MRETCSKRRFLNTVPPSLGGTGGQSPRDARSSASAFHAAYAASFDLTRAIASADGNGLLVA